MGERVHKTEVQSNGSNSKQTPKISRFYLVENVIISLEATLRYDSTLK